MTWEGAVGAPEGLDELKTMYEDGHEHRTWSQLHLGTFWRLRWRLAHLRIPIPSAPAPRPGCARGVGSRSDPEIEVAGLPEGRTDPAPL